MESLLLFIAVSYGITFLIADATLFGCSTTAYNDSPDDLDYIWSTGIFRVRPYLFHFQFLQELFTCYFCLGTWVGPVTHLLLYRTLGDRYWLYHNDTSADWVWHFVVAAMLSAASCYSVNAVIARLESDH